MGCGGSTIQHVPDIIPDVDFVYQELGLILMECGFPRDLVVNTILPYFSNEWLVGTSIVHLAQHCDALRLDRCSHPFELIICKFFLRPDGCYNYDRCSAHHPRGDEVIQNYPEILAPKQYYQLQEWEPEHTELIQNVTERIMALDRLIVQHKVMHPPIARQELGRLRLWVRDRSPINHRLTRGGRNNGKWLMTSIPQEIRTFRTCLVRIKSIIHTIQTPPIKGHDDPPRIVGAIRSLLELTQY